MFNPNQKQRFQDQPTRDLVLSYNHIFGEAALVDLTFGRVCGTYPETYQDEVGPDDISIQNIVRGTMNRAHDPVFLDSNSRWQFKGSNTTGTHDFKMGFQWSDGSDERTEYQYQRNHDLILQTKDGVPFRAQLSNTPVCLMTSFWRASTRAGAPLNAQLHLRRLDAIERGSRCS